MYSHGGAVSPVRVRDSPPPCPPGPLSYQGSIATSHTYGGAEGARKFFFHFPCQRSIPPRPGGGPPPQPPPPHRPSLNPPPPMPPPPPWGPSAHFYWGGESRTKARRRPTRVYSTRAGTAPRPPGGAHHGGGNRAVTSQPRTGQSMSYGDVKPSYMGGQAGGTGGGARQGHPGAPTDRGRSNTYTQNAGATPRGTRAGTADKEEGHSKAGEATRLAGTGPEWSGW